MIDPKWWEAVLLVGTVILIAYLCYQGLE